MSWYIAFTASGGLKAVFVSALHTTTTKASLFAVGHPVRIEVQIRIFDDQIWHSRLLPAGGENVDASTAFNVKHVRVLCCG